MQKVLFIDRDGTIIKEPPDEQIDSFEKLEFLPGVFTYLAKIASELDYQLVMVTNQDGLGTDSFPEETFWPVHKKMLQLLQGEGIRFDDVRIDRTFPWQNAPTRKPGTAMLDGYNNDRFDLENSFVIGDRVSDAELAENLGCKSIVFNNETAGKGDLKAKSWRDVYHYLSKINRKAIVFRKTSETDIQIEVDLDGTGNSDITTGIGFFDHMLEQIARHGGFDLYIKSKGDLSVDEHHTIEDVAISLGEAIGKALGKKTGISRYGFSVPMDDSLAYVAVDFGGRAWLVWETSFKREKVGDMPTEMFFHFFKSFADSARCNLNIKASGDNEHHRIEAIFKAFARACKMAVERSDHTTIPSSKGIL